MLQGEEADFWPIFREGEKVKSLRAVASLLGLFAPTSAFADSAAQSSHYGDVAYCRESSSNVGATRLECKLMPNSGSRVLQIKYVSGECISLPNRTFSVKQFQIVTTPVGTSKVPYQLPTPKGVLNNDFVTGSITFSATQTSIYANPGTPILAYVDIVFPNGAGGFAINLSECTVSLSGAFE